MELTMASVRELNETFCETRARQGMSPFFPSRCVHVQCQVDQLEWFFRLNRYPIPSLSKALP